MPIKVDDPRDIQGSVEDRFNQLNQAEQAPGSEYANAGVDQAEAFANDPNNATDAVRDREQAGAGSDANWQTNINNTSTPSADKSFSGIRGRMSAAAKKGGPFGIILAVLLGGAGFVSFFGGPGLLIVNLAEVMTQKFDYQVTTLDTRHKLIVQSKMAATTDGCSKLSFRCKYSTFSDKELSNFEKSGIKANGVEKTITGRNKIKSFTFNGEEINAKNFAGAVKNNHSFSNAIHGAYNMKFLSKTDKIWGMIEKKFKFSKAAPFDENSTDDERDKKVKDTAEKGSSKQTTKAGSTCDNECTDEEKKAAADSESAKQQADTITELGDGEDSKASQVLDEIKTGGAGSLATNIIKATGVADSVCMVAGWVNTISATAKTIRLAQMIRYGMIFLTTASMIKAGTATPGDVAFLGTIITKVVKDQAGNLSKSGTESFGYRYAAFGDKGIDTNASKAVAGGSFGGKIESAVATIYSAIPGGKKSVKETCHILANPFVQAGSIAAGIAGFFFGASEVKAVAVAGLQVAIGIAAPFLAAYLGEILAGQLIKSSTFGEESMNYITSGSGGMLGQVANYGGGSVMTPTQAVAFLGQQREVAASYANYDRSVLSPFDASSPNTFMGSMFTQFAPYIYSSSTPIAAIRNFASIVTGSAKNLLSPSVSAESAADLGTECQDPQYDDLGVAADPFCNLIIGIPPQYTGVDTLQVQQDMQSADLVDDGGQPKAGGTIADTGLSYPDFIKQCMQREKPYGLDDVSEDKSEECIIDSQAKANAYIHYVDLRIGDMEDADPGAATGTAATGVGGSAANSSSPSTDQLPDYCTNGSLAANDPGQAVCKAYKYNDYGYLWGGGHDGTAVDFVSKFNAGGFSVGTQILDCSGLVRMSIFEAIGVDIGGMSTGDFPGSSNLMEVPKDQAKPGDIVWRNGHVELVVSNDAANQKWYTFGAHTDEAPINEQIGPSSYTYGSMEKVYRVKQ